MAVLRLELVGANPAAHTSCSEKSPGESNYFHGNNPKRWLTNVPNCARVRYENIYPGIDLAYYGNHERVEYDYILAPGADPHRIRVNLRGASNLRLNAAGDLEADMKGSSLLLRKPQAYQTWESRTEQVLASYTISGENVGIEVGSYDPRRPLVIDPVLTYSTYLGGTGGDAGVAITLDPSGNICVVGTTLSVDLPTSTEVAQPELAGKTDVYVTKLTSAGSLVFTTYLGGTADDTGAAIAIGPAGTIFVTGTTHSDDFPTTAGVVQTTFNTPSDAFVTKLSSSGTTLIYSTYLGGTGNDTVSTSFGNGGNGIAVDSLGNAYVTGETNSGTFPITLGAFQTTLGGDSNGFISKLNPGATALVYSSYLGGDTADLGVSVAVDASYNAVIAGSTNSTNFPTVKPVQATRGGGTDAFISKVNPGGTALVYSTYLGGKGTDQAASLALDGSGNVYLTGSTSSVDFPTAGPAQSASAGGYDAFVTKLKADGSALVYSTYLGGSNNDYGNAIAVDSSGNACVVGLTISADFPRVKQIESYNLSLSPYDAFLAEIAAGGGSFTFSSYLGGRGNDSANGVALDTSGSLYVVGDTSSPDFPTTLGSLQPSYQKSSTAFVVKVSPADQPAFSAYPNQLTFSDQTVGTTSPAQGIRIRNMGSAVLNTSSIATTGDFAETDNCGVVGGASACLVIVTFSPTARGESTGTLTFTNNAAGSPQTIDLTGNGLAPVTILSPSSLDFPGEPLNTTGPTQTVTMSNTSADTATITAITTSGDFTQANTCGTKLAAGASCQITVAFTPTLNGTRTGKLTVTDNAAGSPHTVSLTGTGIGPNAKLSARTLTFTEQPVGTTSGPQVLTLTNDGSVAMAMAGIQTVGAFAETTTCGASLAAGTSCTISVTFHPTTSGTNSGVLTIADDAPGSPQTVTLTGNAITGSAPEAYLSSKTLSFGLQPVSTTSATQTVTVTNTGNAPLNVTEYNHTGDFSILQSTCGAQVKAGTSCTTQIAFVPTAAGPANGTYSLTDDASGSPHVVSLTGGGTDFGMRASPGNVAVSAGLTATYALTVIPIYGFKGDVSLTCTGVPATTTCAVSPSTVTADGTNSVTATLTVSTTARSSLLPMQRTPRGPELEVPFVMVSLGLLLMLAVWTAMGATRLRARVRLIAGVLVLALFWGACAVGTEKITGTPAGNYAFTLTGTNTPTNGTGTLQRSLQLGLTVN